MSKNVEVMPKNIEVMSKNVERCQSRVEKCRIHIGCQWIHIGSNKCDSVYKANNNNLTKCNVYKYLGDHVSDGWEPLYQKRKEKSLGYAITCQAMCIELSLGHHLFYVAKLLHEAIFLNGTL